jgi:hypothetical protein
MGFLIKHFCTRMTLLVSESLAAALPPMQACQMLIVSLQGVLGLVLFARVCDMHQTQQPCNHGLIFK